MEPTVLFEDPDLIAINKPAGLITHPTPGKTQESVASWAHRHYPDILRHSWPDDMLRREGIVHRLDQDTSGVLLIARNPRIAAALKEQFASRSTKKRYEAVVLGIPKNHTATIELGIAQDRVGHNIRRASGLGLPWEGAVKQAVTEYTVLGENTYDGTPVAHLQLRIFTGRTHQIRVHLKAIGHPILGDAVYNTKLSRQLAKNCGIARPMLHAQEIGFRHPTTKKEMVFAAPRPADFEKIIGKLGFNN